MNDNWVTPPHPIPQDSMLLPLHALPEGRLGEVELMVLEGTDIRTVNGLGVTVGSVIQSTDVGFSINGKVMVIAPELASQILIRTV